MKSKRKDTAISYAEATQTLLSGTVLAWGKFGEKRLKGQVLNLALPSHGGSANRNKLEPKEQVQPKAARQIHRRSCL